MKGFSNHKPYTMAVVIIVDSTSATNCKCGSWLNHWMKFSGQIITYCPEISCMATDLVGAHVQNLNSEDQSHYVIPLCKKHSQSDAALVIMGSTILVPSNGMLTCG